MDCVEMKIEDEIRQKHFKSDYHKGHVNILFTCNWLESHSKDFFVKYDLTTQQYNILRILRGKAPEPATVNYLKERMIDKMCDASRIVERLRLKGFVERKTCNSDRRSVDIMITEKGQELLKILDVEIDKTEIHLKKLSQSEINTLNELLDKIRS